MYVDSEDKTIARRLLLGCVWERYKTEIFKNILKKGMIVVDVGANIGYYSLIMAKSVGKDSLVYAFEPELSNYDLLVKNINLNKIVPVKKAIADKNGIVNLYFEKDRMVNPSFSKENVLATPKHDILRRGGVVQVEAITLDDFFQKTVGGYKVDIIKVYSEGQKI